jgi:cellulose biosynthesis protein BcsQ
MGIFNKLISEDTTAKLQNLTVRDSGEVYKDLLKYTSGTGHARKTYHLYNSIVGFKGVREGIGTSNIVANTAVVLAKLGVSVCVIDTSIMSPTQDMLLSTKALDLSVPVKDRLDWFDMPYVDNSVTHISKYAGNLAVLSFYGKSRNVLDVLSVRDNEALVTLALDTLTSKYDIILIDFSNEPTKINVELMHRAQIIYQVVNDSPVALDSLDSFVDAMSFYSVPMSKYNRVIVSGLSQMLMGNLDSLLERYKYTKVATTVFSEEVDKAIKQGKLIVDYASDSNAINTYMVAIYDLVRELISTDEVQGIKSSAEIIAETDKKLESPVPIMREIPTNEFIEDDKTDEAVLSNNSFFKYVDTEEDDDDDDFDFGFEADMFKEGK